MSEERVILDTASFLDSEDAASIRDCSREDLRCIVSRFLTACYVDLGLAPRLLDGEAMARLLQEALPRHFGVRDPLVERAEAVLAAYLNHLEAEQVVPHLFELRTALLEQIPRFRESVNSGAAHGEGLAVTGKGKTVQHRVGRVGRNDPCPCGSGKKFKKCCWELGRGL
ncbi:MAG: SEC-C metal-binding domain-containing protein [Planctomycetota bacterium]|jgi:hypothetical protein